MTTCPTATAQSSPSLFQNGNLVFQAHHVGWIIATIFTIVATIASFWLVNKHLQWYSNKREQRFIVRILFMVPIYATISLTSYFFWNHATPLLLIRDAYESTVLTSFFYLLLVYLSPDPDEQRIIFSKAGLSREADREALRKGEDPKKWVFPLRFIKWKPADGLLFLQAMKWGVLQYCVIRPTTTLAAVILEYVGLYCAASWGLGWGHVYITIIVSFSVTIAMYCLIQLYVSVSVPLAPRKPLLKLFAIKAVVFLTFWQSTFLSVLSMVGVVKDTKYMTADDINIGIGALLETFEMMLFAFLHIKAFSYKPYRPIYHPDSKDTPPTRTPRLRSLGHALDFRETFRELWQGYIYLYDKMRGRQPKIDMGARQATHYEAAFGRMRPSHMTRELNRLQPIHDPKDLPALPDSGEERLMVVAGGERQWLGIGDDYGYGLHREKSDGLEVQIEKELIRRGYGSDIPGRGHIKPVHEDSGVDHKRQRSWWRTIYDRISQSGGEAEREVIPSSSRTRRTKSKLDSRQDNDFNRSLLGDYQYETSDLPPVSLIREHNDSRPTDRHRIVSPLPTEPSNHEFALGSPPPPSLFLPHVNVSGDSVLGRVFHGASSVGHSDTPPTHNVPPSGLDIGMVECRSSTQSTVPSARSAHVEIVDSKTSSSKLHRRESAFHKSSHKGFSASTPQPTNPAKIFSQQNAPIHLPRRSSKRTSQVPQSPVLAPQRTRRQQDRLYGVNSRRMSTPTMDPLPQRHSHRTRYSVDNPANNIAQPSFSGTLDITSKSHQIQSTASILADSSRYPSGLLSPSRSGYDIYEPQRPL